MKAGEATNTKSIVSNNFSIISFFFIIILVTVLILLSFYWSQHKTIKFYYIKNLVHYKKSLIDSIVTQNISLNLDFNKLKFSLEQLPFVASCKIYKSENEMLIIDIKEDEPLVLLKDNDGKQCLITSDFNLVSSSSLKSNNFPILFVPSFENSKILSSYHGLLCLIKSIKVSNPDLYSNLLRIEQVGKTIFLHYKNSKIILNSENCFDKISLMNDLVRNGDFQKFFSKEIDLRFENLVVVK